jgi:hypothetical protein
MGGYMAPFWVKFESKGAGGVPLVSGSEHGLEAIERLLSLARAHAVQIEV